MRKFLGFLKKNLISAMFVTATAVGMLLLFIMPKDDISELENRALAKVPKLTPFNIVSGSFSSGVNSYLNDHFPFRSSLLTISQTVDSAIHCYDDGAEIISGASSADSGEFAQVSNDILLCRDRAMEMFEYKYENVQAYAASVNHLQQYICALNPDIRVFSMVIPTSFDFYAPIRYSSGFHCQKNAIDSLCDMLIDDVTPINVYDNLAAEVSKNEYIYFRTDHHWTVRGAYQGYLSFCSAAGLSPFVPNYSYNIDGDFLGTMYYSTMKDILRQNPDYVEVYAPPKEEKCYGFADADLNTRYEFEPLADPGTHLNKYLIFLGGDKPLVHMISKKVKNDKSLLIIKDSYSNAMAQFYLGNYEDVWLLDPRLTKTDIAEFCSNHGIDDVLIESYAIVLMNTSIAQIYDALRPAGAAN